MSGVREDGAQLALLDAMVFFAAALLVSSILVRSAENRPSDPSQDCGYVESLLQSFLSASLCDSVVLDLNGPMQIGPSDQVDECLLVELHSIRSGMPVSAFDPLNEVLDGILTGLVPSPYWFTLSSYDAACPGNPLLTVGREGNHSELTYASTVALTDQEDHYLIVLQLGPPTLPEALRI